MTTATTASAAPTRTIRSVLVANRGEIACRVIASLRAMGIRSIAVYSDADAHAPHVAAADVAVRLGPAPAAQSYLDIDKVVRAAAQTGADAVHPGYGFLSENQEFAGVLAAAGIVFIGPPATAIATMGDKIAAREAVTRRDVPVVPGLSRPGLTDDDLIAAAPDIGFPVLIKPSAGGGGKGMHRVENPADLPAALATARREASAAFGDDTLFLEHFVDTPRHIEVQVLADEHGTVIHLGERECSLQRRHQKVIEEAPSALLDAATRARIGEAACDAARSVGYTGAGTVEFIVSAHRPDEFFFMEMNTRLQVEHPVTEMVTGIDLVEQQIRVARGEALTIAQEDVVLSGHAVEARVYAEDPVQGFLPTGGTVRTLVWPGGAGVRVDAGIETGSVVGTDYDPMLAKIVCHGADRTEALDRLDEALAKAVLVGVGTNIEFCRYVLGRPQVRDGDLDTELLDRLVADYEPPAPTPAALVAGALGTLSLGRPDDVWSSAVAFRIGAPSPIVTRLVCDGRKYTVSALVTESDLRTVHAETTITDEDAGGEPWHGSVYLKPRDGHAVTVRCDGIGSRWVVEPTGGLAQRWVCGEEGTWIMQQAHVLESSGDADAAGDVRSPMPGTVVDVPGVDGSTVEAGDPLVVVEAMKMEHTLRAPVAGTASITVTAGEKVDASQVLAHVTAVPAGTEEDRTE
ncbi:acyl-CoA carboxylase alpha chain [Gordonia araii NBRC 100433]|uniref:biotin carboxylase n=1 Tax=Gordonia araii NBRC 100433 TaxID=1073574 RepID=G7H3I9_9ACTN|nr:biotin carboxylase N-terminal domain-containing protein [Gordonia araii]NNG96532.1 ATP-grasp domain-containing protein [Gordonia araii NBRC 100433]GAB10414.1 acyl-CoA carboxylase alpha chain [Gordonia araii NBRC 100433]